MAMNLLKLVLSMVETLWPMAMVVWEAWGIQLLVLASCFFQIILITLGGRRRYSFNVYTKFIIWASYLLASYIATFTLGKLTVVDIRDPENPDYNVGLKGLLAPLLLVHLANPDCISAYSVEDNKLGIRHVLNLGVTIGFVIWVLIRCWDNYSPVRWLYVPLFIAGVIKSVGTVFALKLVYDDSTSAADIQTIAEALERKPAVSGFHGRILMAYCLFDHLRPHQENWLYDPHLIEHTWLSEELLKAKDDEFTITEIELGFVFDTLYTKTPILCTKIGMISTAISVSCLVSTLCGYSIIFRNAFLLDLYVTYTYALLMVSTIMELYQIFVLPFSHWAVVKMSDHQDSGKVLRFLVGISEKQRRWSNSIQQLNMVDYCLKGDYPKPVSFILRKLHLEERFKRYWRSTHTTIPSYLKDFVLTKIRKPEEKIIEHMPSSSDTGISDNFLRQRNFGKIIIRWHIATDVLLHESNHQQHYSPVCKDRCLKCVSQLLSNYMMCLLARHPYMLSLTTSDIVFEYASFVLEKFFAHRQGPSSSLKETLLQLNQLQEDYPEYPNESNIVTQGWRVLHEVTELLKELKGGSDGNREDVWERVSSAWVEMLCFAAKYSQVYHHARMLRKGGELITHVWLLLTHKNGKVPSEELHPSSAHP